MSKAGLALVIGRAITDAKFFEKLKKDPRQAAKEVTNDLSERELNLLENKKFHQELISFVNKIKTTLKGSPKLH